MTGLEIQNNWIRRGSQSGKRYAGIALRRYQGLHIYGKLLIWLLVFFYAIVLAVIVVVTPSRIAQFLYDRAHEINQWRLGWLVIGGAIVVVCFPPMVGHTTLTTLCGFAYGMKGFFIASSSSLLGSCLVFLILRLLYSKRLRSWSDSNQNWQAFESVVRAKGLPLMILVRMSPFPPWVYSNALFASIEAVSFWQFAIATLFTFPKLLLQAFIGSRMASLSDGDQRNHMDRHTKIINGLFVCSGIGVAIFTSWWMYRLVQKHIQELPAAELAAEAAEDPREGAPLLQDFA